MILVDTGPLVAAANRNDTHHRASTEALAAAPPPRLVPGMVIAEVGYLLARDAGSSVEAEFLRSFKTGFLDVASPTADDLARAADLVEQYADLPLGTTDACIVALAERLNITELRLAHRQGRVEHGHLHSSGDRQRRSCAPAWLAGTRLRHGYVVGAILVLVAGWKIAWWSLGCLQPNLDPRSDKRALDPRRSRTFLRAFAGGFLRWECAMIDEATISEAARCLVSSEQRAGEWRDVRGSLIHAALAEGRELAA